MAPPCSSRCTWSARAFGVAAELAARPVDAKAAKTRREADKEKVDGFAQAMAVPKALLTYLPKV